MSVGGVSTINESFNIPFWVSGLIFIGLVSLTLCLQFDKIIRVLSVVTPFLIVIVLIISIYYIFKHDFNISEGITSIPENKGLYPWWFDAINYSSLQIAAAFSFLSVMGGQLKKGTHAIYGVQTYCKSRFTDINIGERNSSSHRIYFLNYNGVCYL